MSLYQSSILYILHILFFSIIILVILNRRTLIKPFKKIRKKTLIYLLIIFIAACALRLFIFPHFHMMYIDEPWYLEMAKNMNQGHGPVVCEYQGIEEQVCLAPLKPPGWPYLLSWVQMLFGLNNQFSLYFGSILGCLSIILIFSVTCLLFDEKAALWASFILAFSPMHVIWSNTIESNSPSVFFILLSMLLFLHYIRNRRLSSFGLFFLATAFSTMIRFENIILFPILALAYLIYSKKFQKSIYGKFFDASYPLVVICMFGVMIFFESIYFHMFRDTALTLDHFILNLPGYLYSMGIVTVIALAALFLYDKGDSKDIKIIMTCFLFFFITYLPLFKEIEQRMVLTPLVFAVILSGYTMGKISSHLPHTRILFFLLLSIIFSLGLVHVYNQPRFASHKLETDIVMDIADKYQESYIISEAPTVLSSVSDISGISTAFALENPEVIEIIQKNHKVYYFFDGFCTNQGIADAGRSEERCREMFRSYVMKSIETFHQGNYNFILYSTESR